MALIFTRPFFWIMLGIMAVILVLIARRQHLKWLPALLIRFIFLALILAIIFIPVGNLVSDKQSSVQVMLVDQSDSLTENNRTQIKEQAITWKKAGSERILFAYGDKPHAISATNNDWPNINGRASNLASALEIARGLLGNSDGSLIIATDGLIKNSDEISGLLQEITNSGHSIEFVTLEAKYDLSDAYIEEVSVPEVIWQNVPTDVLVSVHKPGDAVLNGLNVSINDTPANNLQIDQISESLFRFQIPPQNPGITTLDINVDYPGDTFPENNHYFVSVQVYDLPSVLFISNDPEDVRSFTGILSSTGLSVEIISPGEIPESARGLEKYKVIFVHNILATQMTTLQKEALQSFTTNLAGGLIFLGGNSSYTLGGYQNTLIESMLPVKLEPPPRSQRSPVLFVLVLDISGSMGQAENGEVKPIDIEREAAMRVIESLKASDHIGVLTYEQINHWKVRIRPLGDGLNLREALDAVSTIKSYGGTNMFAAMEEAVTEIINLSASTPETQHMLVLSDGQSSDGSPSEFSELAKMAQQNNITISTIALGQEADPEIMKTIADEGKGRFYEVQDPENLPQIMLNESHAGTGENTQSGDTSIQSGVENHPVMYAIEGDQLPILHTYNALRSKSDMGAEDILVSSSFEDPILSAWQYGLGRVITWMSDIGEEWSMPWQSSEQEQKFWLQVIQYALSSPTHGSAQVFVNPTDTELNIQAYLRDGDGNPVNLSEVIFTYSDNIGERKAYVLPQVAAGEYAATINRPDEGAYRAVLSYADNSGTIIEVAAPFSVNIPYDWLSIDPEIGIENINTWADQNAATKQYKTVNAAARVNASNSINTKAIQWWLLLTLIILWPLEILIRRRWLPWI